MFFFICRSSPRRYHRVLSKFGWYDFFPIWDRRSTGYNECRETIQFQFVSACFTKEYRNELDTWFTKEQRNEMATWIGDMVYETIT